MNDPEQLPPIPLLHVLWSIPSKFGGMTNATLRRVSALSKWADRDMEVLTFAWGVEPEKRTEQLRHENIISNRVRIRNMWTELEAATDDALASLATSSRSIEYATDMTPGRTAGSEQVRRDAEGQTVQVNHWRGDGTLLSTDTRGSTQDGSVGRRTISLYNRAGQAVLTLQSATTLYHKWLDSVINDERSIIISDSPVTGGIMHSYRRDHVSVVQALHNHHLNRKNPENHLPAQGKFFNLITHADHFDKLVFLTDTQRNDFLDDSFGSDNLASIPNSLTGELLQNVQPRTRGKGIYVARLSPVKRIHHAIKAVAAVNGPTNPTLDIFGEGPRFDMLNTLCSELGVTERVRLHGFQANARSEFLNSSFSLLTSKSEGMSLVLLESMAAGCIPIAYDVDYGPGDIITHGVDGFLVPAGDISELSNTIARLLAMDELEVQTMRNNAVKRAQSYTAEKVCRQWARELAHTTETKLPTRTVHINPSLTALNEMKDGFRLRIELSGADAKQIQWAMISWLGRNKDVYGRTPAKISTKWGRRHLKAFIPKARIEPAGKSTLDLFVDVRVHGNAARCRITVDDLAPHGADGVITPFRTVNGNLSIRVPKSSP